jgi:hypothetical protein
VVPAPFTVSYAEAASRLERLSDATRWNRCAIDPHGSPCVRQRRRVPRLNYDLLPVREDTSPTWCDSWCPGRALPDGRGVLHVLVPQQDQQPRKDQQEDRTVGLLLDQYRADSGTDPSRVQVHRYRIDTKARTVAVTDLPMEGTTAARTASGYREARVDSLEGLRSFLSTTTSLSRLEHRGTELWAGGWNWTVPATARVDVADVSALERGYAPDSPRRPGFSLDPAPAQTTEDLLAVVPGIGRDLADRIIHGGYLGASRRPPISVRSSRAAHLATPTARLAAVRSHLTSRALARQPQLTPATTGGSPAPRSG